MMKKSIGLLVLLCFLASSTNLFAQAFTRATYQKALWMTARFYGGQRSTVKNGVAANWLTQNHTYNGVTGLDFGADADGSYDVSGGWSDCGDNVRYGQTNFYSAYVLLKGYDLWPGGYEDHYSQNYAGYNAAQNYTWEGTAHDPDGIPDILNEVKHATDYYIKCTPNDSTFYYQVGNGNDDHAMWITTVMKAQQSVANGGEARPVYKNPADADMPAFCGATLALMSRKYRSIDAAYADTCLAHALNAYTYATAHPGTVGSPDGTFYGANSSWQPAYACLCTELYLATNTASYKTTALNQSSSIKNHYYCFGYANNDDIAAYNLATLGDANSATLLNTFATTYKGAVTNNIYNGGNTSWGPLRYNANAAFVVALNNLYTGNNTGVDAFIYNQIDFIMGNNTITENAAGVSSNVCFIVGLNATTTSSKTTTAVIHPHHRNVYLDDTNSGSSTTLAIPTHNAQFGYLVGGIRSGNFDYTMSQYQENEGGIDYSACLVGCLAYIMNQTNTNPTPTVTISSPANNASVCAGAITITALPTVSSGSISKVDYYDGTTLLGTVSASPYTYTWTNASAGSHTVGVIATSAASVASSKVTVTVTVTAAPTISAGAADSICNGTSVSLTATGGTSYKWSNGTTTAGNTVSPTTNTTYTVTGTNSGGCSATSSVAVTVKAVPTISAGSAASVCTGSSATLTATGGSTYKWSNGTATAGNTVTPTTTTTYTVTGTNASSCSATNSVVVTVNALPTISAGSPVAICNGSSTTLTATGGSTYKWSNGATTASIAVSPTTTTTYTVTGTNASSCSATSSVVVTVNASPTVSAGSSVSICNGTATTLTATGGATYIWNNGTATASNTVSPTATTTYTVTGTNASSCSATGTVVVTVNALPTISAGSAVAICTGSSTILTATGGSTYKWSNGPTTSGNTVSPTATTTYTVTGTNASSCSSTGSVVVTVNALPTISAGSAVAICNGSSTTLTATGGSTYKWNNGATTATDAVSPTTTTTYTITGTNVSACSATSSVVVTVNAVPAAPTVTSPVTYTTNATAKALTATGTNLLWYTVATGGTGSSAAPTPSTTTVGTADYYVSQTTNSCESSRATIVVIVTQGTITQTVSLVTGWNFISFNVVPTDSTVATVFGGVMSNLSEVKNAAGFYSTTNASTDYNSLTTVEQGQGYLVKMKASATLTVTGIPTAMTATTLFNGMKSGWNMVGCIYQTSTPIATAFDITKINSLKDFSGFYIPNGTTNSLANVVPSYGYFVNKK